MDHYGTRHPLRRRLRRAAAEHQAQLPPQALRLPREDIAFFLLSFGSGFVIFYSFLF